MADELTEREQLAALEGWANNPKVSLEERWATALQLVRQLREYLDECPYPYAGQHYEECVCRK